MDLNGMPVPHGLAAMASLGLMRVVPFSHFGRRELAATTGKGTGEWRSPHGGQNLPVRRRGEAGGEEEQAAAAAISDGRLWSTKWWRKRQHDVW
jgi:hypothetical protein